MRNAATWTTFVDDIDYDAKGQRERIVYGNGVITEYEYDEFTFRVKRIKTTRNSDSKILQDLRYTYDAVGNIVEMADLAHTTFFHAGQEIKPVWQYVYDALYRLTSANGREHAGQQANDKARSPSWPRALCLLPKRIAAAGPGIGWGYASTIAVPRGFACARAILPRRTSVHANPPRTVNIAASHQSTQDGAMGNAIFFLCRKIQATRVSFATAWAVTASCNRT